MVDNTDYIFEQLFYHLYWNMFLINLRDQSVSIFRFGLLDMLYCLRFQRNSNFVFVFIYWKLFEDFKIIFLTPCVLVPRNN